jgi:hypothetical protein
MLLCIIPPSAVLICVAVAVAGTGAGAVAAMFAFLTDLYLEYFAGAATAAAGALSVIVAMAGSVVTFSISFVVCAKSAFARSALPALICIVFSSYTIVVVFVGEMCVVVRGVGRTKCLEM